MAAIYTGQKLAIQHPIHTKGIASTARCQLYILDHLHYQIIVYKQSHLYISRQTK